MTGEIVSINVSGGGVPKRPVPEARVTVLGLEGDRHRDRRHHGGTDRALCLFALERLQALGAEGHAMAPGMLGENLTVRGLPWEAVVPGDRFRLGDGVVIEITAYTSPCRTIAAGFVDGDYLRVSQKHRPGWSRLCARVLVPGRLRTGDSITRIPSAGG
jgi:MOSC domain-containing protein YiiM